MSLNVRCDIQAVRSGFGVNSMKASIHPAFYQQSRLVVCVSWHTLGLLQTAEYHLAQFVLNRFLKHDH